MAGISTARTRSSVTRAKRHPILTAAGRAELGEYRTIGADRPQLLRGMEMLGRRVPPCRLRTRSGSGDCDAQECRSGYSAALPAGARPLDAPFLGDNGVRQIA